MMVKRRFLEKGNSDLLSSFESEAGSGFDVSGLRRPALEDQAHQVSWGPLVVPWSAGPISFLQEDPVIFLHR